VLGYRDEVGNGVDLRLFLVVVGE